MAKKKDRQSKLLSASDVLQVLLANGKSGLSDQFIRWKIWRFWPDVVGETLGQVSEPVGYQRGKIYIWVRSSARLQEMRFFEDTIRDKINVYVGKEWVRWVKFTLDRRGLEHGQQLPDPLPE